MIEAIACGTPVVAFRNGSVPELIEPGINGFIVEDIDSAVEAVHRIPEIYRRCCREVFERRFTSRRMAEDYVSLYKRLIAGRERVVDNAARKEEQIGASVQ